MFPLAPTLGWVVGPLLAIGASDLVLARAEGVAVVLAGAALLVASILAGLLWDAFGPRFAFYAGAGIAVAAWLALWRHGGGAIALRRA